MNRARRRAAFSFLFIVHLIAVASSFVAPYPYAEQHREYSYIPPARLGFTKQGRSFGLTCSLEGESAFPIHFFVKGMGRRASELRLFGTEPGHPCFLLGTDAYGRDIFSRLLYGSRVSLSTGLLAASISLFVGAVLGSAAGFWGGWIDTGVSRLLELTLTIPTLYLLLIIRAMVPLRTGPLNLFLYLIVIIGVIGWARPARLVRGIAWSGRERDYVKAARGFGASDFYILRRHILPQTSGVLRTQFTVLVPQYILAEVALSFLGLGVNEPVPTWGNMLTPLQQFAVLDAYWWLFAPAVAVVPVTLAYYALTDADP